MLYVLFVLLLGCSDGGTASPASESPSSPPPTQSTQPAPASSPTTPPSDPVSPPKPAPLVWAVNAPVNGGLLTGTFTYAPDLQPSHSQTSAKGPTTFYPVVDYDLTISPRIGEPEPIVFVLGPLTPAGATLCLGVECVLDARVLITVTIRDVTGRYIVRLVLQPPAERVPLVNEDWGLWVGNGCELTDTARGNAFTLLPLGEIHLVVPDLKS